MKNQKYLEEARAHLQVVENDLTSINSTYHIAEAFSLLEEISENATDANISNLAMNLSKTYSSRFCEQTDKILSSPNALSLSISKVLLLIALELIEVKSSNKEKIIGTAINACKNLFKKWFFEAQKIKHSINCPLWKKEEIIEIATILLEKQIPGYCNEKKQKREQFLKSWFNANTRKVTIGYGNGGTRTQLKLI